MKQIELSLKERLLIVEYEDEKECIFKVYREYGTLNAQALCKGSELTEQVAKELVNNFLEEMGHEAFEHYNVTENDLEENHWVGVAESALQSFISSIEAQGYYWGENPVRKPDMSPKSKKDIWEDAYQFERWQEAESRTFNPEKSIIFKILKS